LKNIEEVATETVSSLNLPLFKRSATGRNCCRRKRSRSKANGANHLLIVLYDAYPKRSNTKLTKTRAQTLKSANAEREDFGVSS
jgi:hypothetical protein